MTSAIWTPWKWNRFANGKCNSKVIKICNEILFLKKCHRHFQSALSDFSHFCFSFNNKINFIFLNTEKYEYVGRLLRPGEEPNSYSDEEEESSELGKANKSEDIKNINSTDAPTATSDKPKDE